MAKLEDLVPPLDLCKQIPHGFFDDSALVWEKYDDFVCPRGIAVPLTSIPAPTLAEIIYELDNNADIWQDDDGIWSVFNYPYGHESGMTKDSPINPATAALKLWLVQNKGE